MIESATRHAVRVIAEADRRSATSADIRKGPQDRFVRRCRERQAESPLFGPTCATSNTYYVNFQGDSPLRPSLYAEMWWDNRHRSEEHTSGLQSLMRISYAVFCLKKNNTHKAHE